MNVLITGTSRGIGRAAAIKFLQNGHTVFGIDVENSSVGQAENSAKEKKLAENYFHFVADVSEKKSLPELPQMEIVVNNAGIQSGTKKDMDVNFFGSVNVTEKYAFQEKIRSVIFNASSSALTGNEFPLYASSKSALIGYMKNSAIRLANDFRATCNCLCFGGVSTELNRCVMDDENLWRRIMDVTPLKKWATPREAAEWIFFMTAVNSFCTGQAIEISGGERNCMDLFVWK
jgi:3-oxoacyl-[acyl-carrier protein] reductase